MLPDREIWPCTEIPLENLSCQELLQSSLWARFREDFGWTPQAFRISDPAAGAFALLVLSRKLPGGFRLAYLPYGPMVAEPPQPAFFLATVARSIAPHLAQDTTFIRFDPPWGRAGDLPESFPDGWGLRKAPVNIQPPSTVLIDLGLSEQKLLEQMKSKTRYNIRLAEKKGVRVVEGSGTDLPEWYKLYQETARRDRITLHDFSYYRRLFELGGSALRLLLARYEDELLAGIILSVFGKTGRYLYGASSDKNRRVMPNYALQWRAIGLARAEGCAVYDLFGIPRSNDPAEAMFGLYRFKTGFGGSILHRYGSYDLPLKPLSYAVYRRAETWRDWYYHRFAKTILMRG